MFHEELPQAGKIIMQCIRFPDLSNPAKKNAQAPMNDFIDQLFEHLKAENKIREEDDVAVTGGSLFKAIISFAAHRLLYGVSDTIMGVGAESDDGTKRTAVRKFFQDIERASTPAFPEPEHPYYRCDFKILFSSIRRDEAKLVALLEEQGCSKLLGAVANHPNFLS